MDFTAGEILPLYKPYGWTSFQIVSKVRYILSRHCGVKRMKVGHAGTLDPLATGVLFIPHPEVLWLAVGVIALTCFIASMTGFIIGHLVGARLRINVNILGGIILILIGVKIFVEGICS